MVHDTKDKGRGSQSLGNNRLLHAVGEAVAADQSIMLVFASVRTGSKSNRRKPIAHDQKQLGQRAATRRDSQEVHVHKPLGLDKAKPSSASLPQFSMLRASSRSFSAPSGFLRCISEACFSRTLLAFERRPRRLFTPLSCQDKTRHMSRQDTRQDKRRHMKRQDKTHEKTHEKTNDTLRCGVPSVTSECCHVVMSCPVSVFVSRIALIFGTWCAMLKRPHHTAQKTNKQTERGMSDTTQHNTTQLFSPGRPPQHDDGESILSYLILSYRILSWTARIVARQDNARYRND